MCSADWFTIPFSDSGRIRIGAGRLEQAGYDFRIIFREDAYRLLVRTEEAPSAMEALSDMFPTTRILRDQLHERWKSVRVLISIPLGTFLGTLAAVVINAPAERIPWCSALGAILLLALGRLAKSFP